MTMAGREIATLLPCIPTPWMLQRYMPWRLMNGYPLYVAKRKINEQIPAWLARGSVEWRVTSHPVSPEQGARFLYKARWGHGVG